MKPGYYNVDLTNIDWTVSSRYERITVIGQGAFGNVCSAWDTQLNKAVAIKKLSRPFQTPDHAKRTYREMRMLAHVHHENVINLIDIFTSDEHLASLSDVYFVTPLMGADLNAIIKTQNLSDDHIQFLVYQVLRGLKYLHSANIIHRDLKPGNIAVNQDCELKILDFGLARQKDGEMTGYVATRWYRAPEIMLNWMHYNETVDVWSVGCIMAELYTRKPLFPGTDHIDQLLRILSVTGKPDSIFMNKIKSEDARRFLDTVQLTEKRDLRTQFAHCNPDFVSLLESILVLDPDRRITTVQALEHPYMSKFHDETDEPTAELYEDQFEDVTGMSIEEWKELIWNSIRDFQPKLFPDD